MCLRDSDIASVTDAKSVDGLRIGKLFWRSGFIQLTVHIPDATFDDDIAVAFSLVVLIRVVAVSYTHLDVYKRQKQLNQPPISPTITAFPQ